MTDTLVHRLAGFAAQARTTGIPSSILHDAQDRVLDVVGNALAAAREEPAAIVREVVRASGGTEEATAIGETARVPAAAAALVNGTMAHALDFDDTHLPSVLHPSASVVPAALALGEAVGSTGLEVLTAVAIGDEICVRLGMASYDTEIRNSIFFENGLHATSIIGTLAAAAAGAMLLNLDEGGIADAIGIAASMGAGILEANRTGGSVKRIHCGWAAHAGVNAALLARYGLTGPPTVLEGRFGFFRAYSEGRFDRSAIVDGLGEEWELPRIFYKPYPTNHFTHAGIDAALALRAGGLDPARIVDIELGVPEPVLRTIAEPPEQKARPLTPYHAKFSGPFTVATALVGGGGLGVSGDDFNDSTLADPERLRLAGLVRCVADEEATEVFPHQFPGVLTARLDDGTEMSERVRHNRGGPDRPLSPEELATKFRLNAEQALPAESVNAVEAAIRRLDEADGLGSLMDQMH
jgi:2-methylcitrate dehydratase PrpD